jgi:hypothetical protein
MSLIDVKYTNSSIIISHCGWVVTLQYINETFSHCDPHEYRRSFEYNTSEQNTNQPNPKRYGVYYSNDGLTFVNIHTESHDGLNCATVDIGLMNKDETFGDYSSVWILNKDFCTIRDSAMRDKYRYV